MIHCLYLISGMGADENIFLNLDLGELRTGFIPWQKVAPGESFEAYVRKLAQQIDTSEKFGICGVSLGGITAQEMSRFLKPEFLILISTIKGPAELPPILRAAASTSVQKVIPEQFYKWAAMHSASAAGLKSEHENALFQQMIAKFGEDYYKWCINAVAEWQGVELQVPYLHLHGSKDIVFPSAHISNATIIKDGTHFMVMNMAEEISQRIKEFISQQAEN